MFDNNSTTVHASDTYKILSIEKLKDNKTKTDTIKKDIEPSKLLSKILNLPKYRPNKAPAGSAKLIINNEAQAILTSNKIVIIRILKNTCAAPVKCLSSAGLVTILKKIL